MRSILPSIYTRSILTPSQPSRRTNHALVLTRHIGEKIIINNDTEVTVLEIKGGQVKLGFDAPEHVPIVREELLETGGT